MRVSRYLLFFLSNPIRHPYNIINDHKFIESPTKHFNDIQISRNINQYRNIKTLYSQKDNIFNKNEDTEPSFVDDTSLSDLYTNPKLNIQHNSDIDSDSDIQDPDFIPDLNDSPPFDTPKPIKPISISSIPINSNKIDNSPIDGKKPDNSKFIPTSSNKLGQNKERYIIQNKIPRLFGERMYHRAQLYQEEFTERRPKKLLKSARSGTVQPTGLDTSSTGTAGNFDFQNKYLNQNPPETAPQSAEIDAKNRIVNVFDDIKTDKGEYLSKSSTWDIPTSQIRVKGAYFIQRYIQELREPFKKHDKDTGSSEIQIASLTARIDYLVEHVKKSPKDISAKLKLLKLAHRRRKHLAHLFKTDKESFQRLVETFNLHFDHRPYTYEKVLPEYVYRRRTCTKRTYTKEGRTKPFISSYPRFDNITLDMLIK